MDEPTFSTKLITRRDVQIRAAVGIVMIGLFAAFAILQFMALDQATRNPSTMTIETTSGNPAAQAFPAFTVCPSYKSSADANLTSLTCHYSHGAVNVSIPGIVESTRSIFSPRAGVRSASCRDVYPSLTNATSVSFEDLITCTANAAVDLLIYIYSPLNVNRTTPQNNFDWLLLEENRDSYIGLTQRVSVTSSGTIKSIAWGSHLTYFTESVVTPNEVYFAIQFYTASPIKLREYYSYNFWTMIGIVGGAAVIFYVIYYVLVFALFQCAGFGPDGKPQEVYDDIEDK